MKKRLLGLMAAVVIVLFAGAVLALAQETTTVSVFGVEIDFTTIDTIVLLLGGGIVTLIVQFIKKKIGFVAEGVGAFLLTFATCFGTTAVYFLVLNPMSPWDWLKFIIYGVAVLGESTGYFHLYKKITKTPATN